METFKAMYDEAVKQYEESDRICKGKKEELQQAETEKERVGRELVRLQRIDYLAGYAENPLKWRLRKWEETECWVDYEWKRLYELESSKLGFTVCLSESKKLKKMKYVVGVRAWKTTLSGTPGAIHGGYRSDEYGIRKYMKRTENGTYEDVKGMELSKKFATQEEAEVFANEWMERLYCDHIEEIEADQRIYDMLRKDVKESYEHVKGLIEAGGKK